MKLHLTYIDILPKLWMEATHGIAFSVPSL